MISIRTIGEASLHVRLAEVTRLMADLSPRLEKATELVYEATRQRFEGEGDGEWPQLSEATVARKEAKGSTSPERILYDTGDLFEAATSPNYSPQSADGPSSHRIIEPHRAVIQVVWERDGYQIPTLLSAGTDRMPARPIWPHDEQLVHDIGDVLLGKDHRTSMRLAA